MISTHPDSIKGARLDAQAAAIAKSGSHIHDPGCGIPSYGRCGTNWLTRWLAAMSAEVRGERTCWFVAGDSYSRRNRIKAFFFEKGTGDDAGLTTRAGSWVCNQVTDSRHQPTFPLAVRAIMWKGSVPASLSQSLRSCYNDLDKHGRTVIRDISSETQPLQCILRCRAEPSGRCLPLRRG